MYSRKKRSTFSCLKFAPRNAEQTNPQAEEDTYVLDWELEKTLNPLTTANHSSSIGKIKKNATTNSVFYTATAVTSTTIKPGRRMVGATRFAQEVLAKNTPASPRSNSADGMIDC